jgi:hypothetical protein
MWHLTLLALASAASGQHDGATVDGVAFGPRLTLTCTWFSNFENSRFERCQADQKNVLPSDDGASIKCRGKTCDQLDAEARKAANWREAEPPWGNFTVRIIGRVALRTHKKQYIGDGTSMVLIEELLSVRTPK